MTNVMSMAEQTQFLERPDGRVAYEVVGRGPLLICTPGMGDLRSVYRFMAPALAEAGYRVALMDLRGHGDSDATFTQYDDVAVGYDLLALTRALGGPAILVGNSMSAGASVWAAAEASELIAGLVLIGPFVRNVPISGFARAAFRLALQRPWGRAAWVSYYRRLYPGQRPHDLATHEAAIRASLGRPDHWRAFVATTQTSHVPAERRLAEVAVPTLVVMGVRDPDFPNPQAEAHWIADRLSGRVVMIDHAGHYPQAEYPNLVTPAVLSFLKEAGLAAR
ncbi:alpha/beta fold hydrolase [Sulfobacillus harzensis]|uniref:Alpha/beta hydrolase n=1 Tax=Sulfobacillus harzensis TaxID=2729629 RepID=A0A7Y0L862_9FIRM|nr:alpha/beta hydrolase [Sulfobacillus harzensis]NMP24551.1 alpha/beta hydrolase [Sulfobacillus harzensis]